MSDEKEEKAPKKKGKLGKILVMVVGVLVLLGGGVGAGLYAANSGLIGGGHGKGHDAEAEADANHPGPKLVPKSEQKRAGEGGEGEGGHGGGGEGGGHGEEGGEAKKNVGMPRPPAIMRCPRTSPRTGATRCMSSRSGSRFRPPMTTRSSTI